METIIFKSLKVSQMDELFEKHYNKINIRFYKPKISRAAFDEEKRYKFVIRIRHDENTSASELFNRVFAEVFQKKNTKPTKTKLNVKTSTQLCI